MAMNKKPEPWERQEGESAKDYEAFCVYRDLGPGRSLKLVAKMCNKSETIMGRRSGKFDWVRRAALWDDEQDRIERKEAQEAQVREIRKMRKRQADSGYAMQIKGLEALKKLPLEDMSAQDDDRGSQAGTPRPRRRGRSRRGAERWRCDPCRDLLHARQRERQARGG